MDYFSISFAIEDAGSIIDVSQIPHMHRCGIDFLAAVNN
jgi:hypothetical protein